MIFQSLFQQFQLLSSGTDAFKQLKNQCEYHIQHNEYNLEKSGLFLIYTFSKNYVLLYEDQAVSSEFANQAKSQLIAYMQILNHAILSQDKIQVLDAINHISAEYMQSSRIF